MQHGYSTRFAVKSQNKLHVLCCPFYCTLKHTVAQGTMFFSFFFHLESDWSFLCLVKREGGFIYSSFMISNVLNFACT